MDKTLTDILLINKNLALTGFTVDILKNKGYSVHTVSNMRDALLIISQKPVGLILCGLELEDISGEQFLSYLKKDPLREAVPFVFFLPLENQKKFSPERMIKKGAEDLIFFPLEVPDLLSRIKGILQPHRSCEKRRPTSSNNDVKSALAGLKLKPRIERRSEKRQQIKVPAAVEVSHDGKIWIPGKIVNTSKSGAMIETTLRRRYGQTVQIRKPKDENGPVVSGSIVHALLGAKNKWVGIGVIFLPGTEWSGFCERLSGGGIKLNAGSIRHEIFPIAVEVSQDGHLWVDSQILCCNPAYAQIKTFMLAKPEETVLLKFDQQSISSKVVGKVKAVELENKASLVNIDLDFDHDSGWPEVFAYFADLPDPVMIGTQKTEAHSQISEAAAVEVEPDKNSTLDKWSKTIVVQNVTRPKSGILIPKPSPQKLALQNKRFYQSLIGRKMDNYEVVSYISSGAMGGVFKAWDAALERDVAMKIISWELSSRGAFVKMFYKEARFVSKLNHPNISQIYYICNANDIIYYTMEFVHGKNLLELIKNRVRLETSRVANYLRTACRALDYVWKNKIIHRDIKPANIMVTGNDELKIVDFGVAKLDIKANKKADTKIVGSPLYLSPETILNQKVDHRSDIYSLGATFFHLITGTPPFFDLSIRNILNKHLHDPVPSLKKKSPDTPGYLCDIIERMIAKKVENRFQSYQEIIQHLDGFAAENKM